VKSILFVDDEKNILDGVRRLLSSQRNDWDMHFALSGEAALKECDTNKFDVVVSDMRMPGMDGATLLGHIRDRFPDAARLILSGYADAVLANRAVSVAHRVLAKPCNGEQLQINITRVCKLQELFCTPELRKVIGTIGQLPSLSRTYTALSQATRDPATPLAKVADIVEKDVAMSAKVLQLVNSGFFGLARSVTNLQEAVNYLGMETIRNLALASDTFRVFTPSSSLPPAFGEDLQRQSRRTALIVRTLNLRPEIRDICIMAALLHDIGRLVLACKMPASLCAAMELASTSGCREFEAEEQLLGTSHAEIGAYLLGLWGIDGLIVEAVAHHHRPDRIPHTEFDSSGALYIADLLAQQLDAHPDDALGDELSAYDRSCIETLGLWPRYPALWKRAREVLDSNVTH
jgi:HD-like signal output (HDOD) protein/ActR/RegA family two-component response regulator